MKAFFSILVAVLTIVSAAGQPRSDRLLEKHWKFTRADSKQFAVVDFDDHRWQTVRVPHDWAIYGPFSADNDLQTVAIVQDGQTKAEHHAGRTGGLPFVGVGWYRTAFDVPETAGKKHFLLFDGAMSHATVYVNGQRVGSWPYGYNSFYFDVTAMVRKGTNRLAVRLENLPESSRWYPGAGLYRNVRLIAVSELHIPVWGTQITTPTVTDRFADVRIKTLVERPETMSARGVKLATTILDSRRNEVASVETILTDLDTEGVEQTVRVVDPERWDVDHPALYTAVSNLYDADGRLCDSYETPFGIRTFRIIPDSGLFVNGRRTVFKGVCLHHDLGPLGAAVNDAAIRRQLRLLKEMGCNAIRTSHNMPAPELIRACDEMGMMVMAETFDEWNIAKCRNGYHRYFDQWAERDLTNLLHRYRNSPSIVMWCIGNEVPNQGDPSGAKLSRWLQDICHREDPTRPVTQGLDQPGAVIYNNMAAAMQVAGFNYRPHRYAEAYEKLPQGIILGSETASTVSSRGVYKFPVRRRAMAKYPDHQSSSYDVEHCSWSNLPEDDFIQHDDRPYCIGEFVWTGFDYLGEPTPYYTDWPNHSSLFGIIDLAGIPKDRYYLYRSHWNRSEETLHILPHWTWPGREGLTTPVFVYTNYPSAELFINGKSQGRRTKNMAVHVDSSENEAARQSFERQKRYRLMWMETTYEPGTIKVVAYDDAGRPAAEKELRTAGKPHRILLEADRTQLTADGKDLAFITVKVVDAEGNECPDADLPIRFRVEGAGSYRAAANGDVTCTVPFHQPQMPLFKGALTAIVQAGEQPGEIRFEASADGLESAVERLYARPSASISEHK